jgi:DNA adenine methylase
MSLKPKPFLKWAGGKRALLPQIRNFLPGEIEKYYEPFLGAGSVFFDLPAGHKKIVSDFNKELISLYEVIRDDVEEVLNELGKLTNTKEKYLEVRAWDRNPEFDSMSVASRAARFIFLNKCGFNGLYRVNKQGHFNVPYGSQKNVDFVSENNLRAVSQFLNTRDSKGILTAEFTSGDYKEILVSAKGPGSFVYFDPPYHPISDTSSFVSYNENGFGIDQQIELRDEILRLTDLGVRILLSNSDTEFIRDIFSGKEFQQHVIPVRRAIAAKSNSRGVISELLIENYEFVRSRS